MPELKTEPALLDALKKASRQHTTADEVHEQRISFIMGNLNKGSEVTRAQVEKVLADQEGR